jgi:hypothetical protein
MPIGNVPGFTMADDLIAEANKLVCAAHEVPDYRLIDHGKGMGALAAALSQLLEKEDSDAIVMLSSHASNHMADTFRRYAKMIVQGV